MRNADNIRLTPPPQERGRLVCAKPCPELAGGPPALRSLPIPVQWHDRAWRPRLVVRFKTNEEVRGQIAETDLPGSFVCGVFPPSPFRLQHSRHNTFPNL